MEQGKVERGEGAVQYGPLKYRERARINPSSPRVKQGSYLLEPSMLHSKSD